jgi:hypothetical protein
MLAFGVYKKDWFFNEVICSLMMFLKEKEKLCRGGRKLNEIPYTLLSHSNHQFPKKCTFKTGPESYIWVDFPSFSFSLHIILMLIVDVVV